jgi:hypothetical protein
VGHVGREIREGETVEGAQESNGKHDVITHRLVVGCLGCVVILCAVSCTILPLCGHEIPPSIPALGGTALGALTGMLAAVMKGAGDR